MRINRSNRTAGFLIQPIAAIFNRLQQDRVEGRGAGNNLVCLSPAMYGQLTLHRHQQQRSSPLGAAQRRNRLTLHPQPSATRLSLSGGTAESEHGVEAGIGNQGSFTEGERITDSSGGAGHTGSQLQMILRLSQKLCTKLKAGSLKTMQMDDDPFADWSAHLFVADRT
jgi:hypothetical protein